MSLGTRLFVAICPALLPPIPAEGERDYYRVLGVPARSSTPEDDIRKAYRQKSLALHPDKVAQRRQANAEAAAAEYLHVQEAYAVLMDPEQRAIYHAVGLSPCRYRFWTTGGVTNPVALYENLAQASTADKTRLVLVWVVVLFLVLLQPILMAAKVNAVLAYEECTRKNPPVADCEESVDRRLLDAKWVALLIPVWFVHSAIILFWIVLTILAPSALLRGKMILTMAEQMAWLIGFIMVAHAWDENAGSDHNVVQWHAVATPFYVAILLQLAGMATTIQHLREEQAQMVSAEQFHEIAGEHATEERLMELSERYTVVTVHPEVVAVTVQMLSANRAVPLTDDEMEHIKVQSSEEYLGHDRMVRVMNRTMASTALISIPFIALVAGKLNGQLNNASWWLVFFPIWLHMGWRLLQSCITSCSTTLGDDEMVVLEPDGDGGEGQEQQQQHTDDENGESATPQASGEDDEQKYDHDDQDVEVGEDGILDFSHNNKAEAVPFDERIDSEPKTNKTPSPRKPISPPATGMSPPRRNNNESAPLSTTATGRRPDPDDGHPADDDTINQEAPFDERRDSSSPPQTPERRPQEPPGLVAENMTMDDMARSNRGDDGENQSGDPELDEETFRAWQQAFAQAEESALEKQAKAQTTCDWVCFQFLILCLVVGKLEQDYDENGRNAPAGFNAYWILFPIFFVAGILLCCCSCLIYGAGASQLDDLVEQARSHDDSHPSSPQHQQQQQSSSYGGDEEQSPHGIIVPPPPPPPPQDENGDDDDPESTSYLPPRTTGFNRDDVPPPPPPPPFPKPSPLDANAAATPSSQTSNYEFDMNDLD